MAPVSEVPTRDEVVPFKKPPLLKIPTEGISRENGKKGMLEVPKHVRDKMRDAPGTPVTPETPVAHAKPFEQQVQDDKASIQQGQKQDGHRRAIVRHNLAIDDSRLFQTVDLQEEPVLTDSIGFVIAVAVVAVLNMFAIGFEADLGCWNCPIGDRLLWYISDNVFSLVFAMEMALRIFVRGAPYYFVGDGMQHLDWQWLNSVDFLIVVLRCLDTWVLMPVGVDVKLKILSCFRVIHLAPIIKRMRLDPRFRELWIIISLLTDTYKIIFWVLCVLLLIIWIVAIVMTILFGKEDDPEYDFSHSAWSWKDYWGTVPRSMFSLFQVVTLDKWASSLIRPIFKKNAWVILIIVPFICISTLGLVNVIVAVIVESTIASATANEERLSKKMQKVHAEVMESLRMIFEEADTNRSGDLDEAELCHMVEKANVRDRLALLDITVKDLKILFELLDPSKIGSISTDKFFRGCARLRGKAMSCDLHRMSIDLSRYIQWTSDLVGHNRNTNKRLRDLLHDIAGVDRDIIKSDEDEGDPVLMNRRARAQYKAEAEAEEDTFEEELRQRRSMSKRSSGTGLRTMLRKSNIGFNIDDIRVSRENAQRDYTHSPPPPPLPSHLLRRNTAANDDDRSSTPVTPPPTRNVSIPAYF